jgi:hypothetical protein
MQSACPYYGENPGPGKDVYAELDSRAIPSINLERERTERGAGTS